MSHNLAPCPHCHIWHCTVCGCRSIPFGKVAVWNENESKAT